MREVSAIEKMELAKATMEALGFDFSEMTVGEAFEMYRAIRVAVSDKLAEQFASRISKFNQTV